MVYIDQQASEVLIKGVSGLVETQLRFADEFGLSQRRVFPESYEVIAASGVSGSLRSLLIDDNNGAIWLERLFISIRNHQLGLVRAFDGVALQAYAVLTKKTRWSIRGRTDYSCDHSARFRDLIAPGVLHSYIKYIEEGA